MSLFLLLYSENIPWGVKTQYCQSHKKNHIVNCLTCEENTRKPYNDNVCLFGALALHSQGNARLEEEPSKKFDPFLEKIGGSDQASLHGVGTNDFPFVEDFVQVNILLCDISIVD